MMAVIRLIEHNLMLAFCMLGYTPSEDVGDARCGEPGQAQIAGSLKDGMDRVVALEDDILSMFYLVDEVVATQVHVVAFVLRELGAEHERPVVQPFLNAARIDGVGSSLQRIGIGYAISCYRCRRSVGFIQWDEKRWPNCGEVCSQTRAERS